MQGHTERGCYLDPHLTHKIEFIPEKRRVSINDCKLPINWHGW